MFITVLQLLLPHFLAASCADVLQFSVKMAEYKMLAKRVEIVLNRTSQGALAQHFVKKNEFHRSSV